MLHQIIATRVLYGCHERRQQLRPLPGYIESCDFPDDDGDLECHFLSRLSQAAEKHSFDGGPLLVADGVGRSLSPRYEIRVCKSNTLFSEKLIPDRSGSTISSTSSIPVSVDAVFDVKHGLPSHGNRGRDIRYDGGKCVVKPFLGLEGLQFLLCCLDVGRVLRAGGPEDEDELFAGTHPVYVTVWLQVESEVRDSETFIRNVSS